MSCTVNVPSESTLWNRVMTRYSDYFSTLGHEVVFRQRAPILTFEELSPVARQTGPRLSSVFKKIFRVIAQSIRLNLVSFFVSEPVERIRSYHYGTEGW